MDHKYVFLGGLHRSGTSLFRDLLTAHPDVSGLEGTGAIQDEGQFLQTVYPRDRKLGGPGRFAFEADAHITEDSKLVSEANRTKLVAGWSRYWDLSRPVLIEKSPSNMLKTRFLQALFPESTFIILVRHPVIVTLATLKWQRRRAPTSRLLDHWFAAHDLLRMDSLYIRRLRVVRYEELVGDAPKVLADVAKLVDIQSTFATIDQIDASRTDRYRVEWDRWRGAEPGLVRRYEHKANLYGYSLDDLTAPVGDFPVATPSSASDDPADLH